MAYHRIGVVTGANKGIGLAIVRQLALQYPTSPLNGGPLLIYLTARDQRRGEDAVKNLEQDSQLHEAKALRAEGGLTDIQFHALDITDSNSVNAFVRDLKETHGDGIDFVINNAGIAMDGFDLNVVETTLHCNYYSTLAICHALLPILKSTGRLVNVASTAGALNKYSPAIRDRFLAAKTEADVTDLMVAFHDAVQAGKQEEAGFPSAAYAVSKAGLIGGTRALATSLTSKGSHITVNSCCPGYVNTDMTKGNGTKTPDAGAQTPVMLALQDLSSPSGSFWRDGKVVEW